MPSTLSLKSDTVPTQSLVQVKDAEGDHSVAAVRQKASRSTLHGRAHTPEESESRLASATETRRRSLKGAGTKHTLLRSATL